MHRLTTPFSFLDKYKKWLFSLFIGYALLTFIVCYYTNFNNHLLKKQEGIIEEIKMNIIPVSSYSWYFINIKFQDNPVWYVQVWQVPKNPLFYFFLFGETNFTKDVYFIKGSYAELYLPEQPRTYDYLLTERENFSGRSAAYKYRSLPTPEGTSALISYGLRIGDETIMDYKKRNFIGPLYQRMSIGLYLLFVPVFLLLLFKINAILTRFIRK